MSGANDTPPAMRDRGREQHVPGRTHHNHSLPLEGVCVKDRAAACLGYLIHERQRLLKRFPRAYIDPETGHARMRGDLETARDAWIVANVPEGVRADVRGMVSLRVFGLGDLS